MFMEGTRAECAQLDDMGHIDELSWAEMKNFQLTLSKLLRELFLLVFPGG